MEHEALRISTGWLQGVVLHHQNGVTAKLIGSASSRCDSTFVQCQCPSCTGAPLLAQLDGVDSTCFITLVEYLTHADPTIEVEDEDDGGLTDQQVERFDAQCRQELQVTTPQQPRPVSGRRANQG